MTVRLRVLLAGIVAAATLAIPVLAVQPALAVDVISPVCKDIKTAEKPPVCEDAAAGATENPIAGENGVLTVAIQILSILAGVSAVIMIIIAGLKIIFSNGDSTGMAAARKQIIYACAGLAVVVASHAIVTYILSRINS